MGSLESRVLHPSWRYSVVRPCASSTDTGWASRSSAAEPWRRACVAPPSRRATLPSNGGSSEPPASKNRSCTAFRLWSDFIRLVTSMTGVDGTTGISSTPLDTGFSSVDPVEDEDVGCCTTWASFPEVCFFPPGVTFVVPALTFEILPFWSPSLSWGL